MAARYHKLLSDMPGLTLPVEPEWARTNWQSYCVRLPDGLDQREVMQEMLDEGDRDTPRNHVRAPGSGILRRFHLALRASGLQP